MSSLTVHIDSGMQSVPVISILFVPMLVGCGIALGFLRELLIAYFFGTSDAVEVFRVASGLPMVLGDTLVLSFSTVLVRRLVNPGGDWVTIKRAAAAVSYVTFVLGVLTMPVQAYLLAPGADLETYYKITIAGVFCWTFFLVVSLTAPFRAALISDNIKWPMASAVSVRNAGFIVFFLFLVAAPQTNAIVVLVAAAVLSYIALFYFLRAASTKCIAKYANGLTASSPRAVKSLARGISISVVGVGLAQVGFSFGRLYDRGAASYFPSGTLAAMDYSYSITLAIASFCATTINVVYLPRFARRYSASSLVSTRPLITVSLFALVATLVAVIVAQFSDLLVSLVYERGAFTDEDVSTTSEIFRWQILGVGAVVVRLVLAQFFILRGMESSLAKCALSLFPLKVISAYFVFHLVDGVAAIGIAFAVHELLGAGLLIGVYVAVSESGSRW